MRHFLFICLATALTGLSASPVASQTLTIVDTITGYTITRENRNKTCHASTDLQSIQGKGVGFTLHLTKRGKSWQTLAYGRGAKPKKRKDTLTVQFDGAVFYTRKIRLGRDGVFDLPHRNRRETARFVAKLTSQNNMVFLLRGNRDGLVVRLKAMSDVVRALKACADSF